MSFFFFILYLICVFIRPQEWVPAVLNWPLIYVFSIATIIALFFESAGGKRLVKAPQSGLMVWLFLTIFMSHIVHTYFGGLTLSFDAFFPTFILFFTILNAINTEGRLKFAVWSIILIMSLLAVQGVVQLKTGVGLAGQPLLSFRDGLGGFSPRITWVGIFDDPNDLALTFTIAVGLLLPFVFGKANFLTRLISLGLLGCLGYGIFLTNSRGGQLALLATMFFFFVRKTKKFLAGSVLGGLVSAVILALGPSRMGALSTSEASAANRLDIWYEGIQLFRSSPVFGIGQGLFADDLGMTAHNSFVLAFSELGFVGLFLWVGLIYISMKGLLLVQNRDERLVNWALGIQSALVGFCAAAFFLSRLYIILPYMLFAMAGSTVWLSVRNGKMPELKFDVKDARNVFWLSVGVFLLVFLMIKVGM